MLNDWDSLSSNAETLAQIHAQATEALCSLVWKVRGNFARYQLHDMHEAEQVIDALDSLKIPHDINAHEITVDVAYLNRRISNWQDFSKKIHARVAAQYLQTLPWQPSLEQGIAFVECEGLVRRGELLEQLQHAHVPVIGEVGEGNLIVRVDGAALNDAVPNWLGKAQARAAELWHEDNNLPSLAWRPHGNRTMAVACNGSEHYEQVIDALLARHIVPKKRAPGDPDTMVIINAIDMPHLRSTPASPRLGQ